jgi:hypothetical protein
VQTLDLGFISNLPFVVFVLCRKYLRMKRLKRQFVTDEKDTQIDVGLIQHLMSKNSEVSFLSLYSHQASEIYSDRKLMEFFEFKMWISVSKDYDVIKLGELPISLQRYIVGKRFLLVIDNVWTFCSKIC